MSDLQQLKTEKPHPDLTIKDGQWCEASDSDEIYRYRIELAKSGRAKCAKCCELIEKGSIRLGMPIRWKQWFNSWCHHTCFRIKGTKSEITKILHGIDSLNKKQKGELLEELSRTDIPEKLKPKLDDSWRPSKSAEHVVPLTTLSIPLLEFQQVGVAWMINQESSSVKGGILADEMGMGKTIQTIALIVATKQSSSTNKPTLVICPSSALGQWSEEITRFAPSLNIKQINHLSDIGSAPSSHKKLLAYDIVLTTYSIAEHSYRRVVDRTKVVCKYCKKKYLPNTLVTHQQYFCGPKAVRSKKLALREKKTKVAAEKAKATLGISSVPSMTNIYKELMHEAGQKPIGRYDKGERARKRDEKEATENLVVKPIGMERLLIPSANIQSMTGKKLALAVQDRYGFEPDKIKLIYDSKLVGQNNMKLSSHGIKVGSTVHVAFDLSKENPTDSEREDGNVRKTKLKKKPANMKKGNKKPALSSSSDSDSSEEPTNKSRPGRSNKKVANLSDSSESSTRRKVTAKKPARKTATRSSKAALSTSDSESLKTKKSKAARKPSKKKSKQISDSDTDSSSDYKPTKKPIQKTSKNRNSTSKSKPSRKPSKRSKKDSDTDDGDSDSSSSSIPIKSSRKPNKKVSKKVSKSETSSSSSSSSSSDSSPAKKKSAKKPTKKITKSIQTSDSDSYDETSSYVSMPTSAYMSSTSDDSDDPSSDSEMDSSGEVSSSESEIKSTQPLKKHKLDLSDSLLHSVTWRRLIIDEAHRVKGKTCSTAKSIFAIEAKFRWGLTGTPLQNRVIELGSLVRYLRLDPYSYYGCSAKGCKCKSLDWNFGWKQTKCPHCDHASFKHYSHFNKFVMIPISRYGCIGDGHKAFTTLRKDILERMQLRRTKNEVASQIDIPPMNIIIHRGKLDDRERDFYEALYKRSTAKFDAYVEQGSLLHNYAHIFELLARLRQAVDHPLLVTSKDKVTKRISAPPATCAVCGDTIDLKGNDKKTFVKAVPCKHLFHGKCAALYLEMTTNDKVPCPAFCCDKELSQDQFRSADEQKKKKDDESSSSSDSDKSDVEEPTIMTGVSKSNFTSSTKVEDLLKYIKAIPEGEKCVIFSQYAGMLDIIKWRLSRENVSILKLTGSMSIDSRTSTLKRFKTDPSITGLLLSLRAGGEGLNLQVANHVFTVDPWWNPAIEMQAIQRVHRIGQTKPVTAVRFVTSDTIEDRMYDLQAKKQLVFDGTIDGSSAALAKLNGDDISFLFNH